MPRIIILDFYANANDDNFHNKLNTIQQQQRERNPAAGRMSERKRFATMIDSYLIDRERVAKNLIFRMLPQLSS
jgi:signal transduction protein with GAF and PtsI domain